jgi:hypothetical protein
LPCVAEQAGCAAGAALHSQLYGEQALTEIARRLLAVNNALAHVDLPLTRVGEAFFRAQRTELLYDISKFNGCHRR